MHSDYQCHHQEVFQYFFSFSQKVVPLSDFFSSHEGRKSWNWGRERKIEERKRERGKNRGEREDSWIIAILLFTDHVWLSRNFSLTVNYILSEREEDERTFIETERAFQREEERERESESIICWEKKLYWRQTFLTSPVFFLTHFSSSLFPSGEREVCIGRCKDFFFQFKFSYWNIARVSLSFSLYETSLFSLSLSLSETSPLFTITCIHCLQ